MSGPKNSRYYLERRQRQLLLEEQIRKENIRKEKERTAQLIALEKEGSFVFERAITQKKESLIQEIKTVVETIKTKNKEISDVDTIISCAKEYNVDDSNYKKLKDIQGKLEEIVKKNIQNSLKVSLEELNNRKEECDSILQKLDSLIKGTKKITSDIVNKNIDSITDGKKVSIASLLYKERANRTKFSPAKYIDKLKSFLSADGDSAILSIDLIIEISEVLEEIKKFTEPNELRSYCEGYVNLVISKVNKYIDFKEKNIEKYNELLNRNNQLCKIVHKSPGYYPFSKEGLLGLEKETKENEELASEIVEQNYVNEVFNSILEEMGYTLKAHRSVANEYGEYTNRLYKFSEENVASVTYNADGNIAIEIGKLDMQDRKPTEDEKESQVKDMEKLCELLPEIEERLAQKNIKLKKRIQACPPNKNYSTVINGNDFGMEVSEKNENDEEVYGKYEQKQLVRYAGVDGNGRL